MNYDSYTTMYSFHILSLMNVSEELPS